MVSICPLLWQRDVKLQQTNKLYNTSNVLWISSYMNLYLISTHILLLSAEIICWRFFKICMWTFEILLNIPFGSRVEINIKIIKYSSTMERQFNYLPNGIQLLMLKSSTLMWWTIYQHTPKIRSAIYANVIWGGGGGGGTFNIFFLIQRLLLNKNIPVSEVPGGIWR